MFKNIFQGRYILVQTDIADLHDASLFFFIYNAMKFYLAVTAIFREAVSYVSPSVVIVAR